MMARWDVLGMFRTRRWWQELESTIIQLYIDGLGHERTSKVRGVRSGWRVESGFRAEVGRVRVETDNDAFDILHSKRLLNRGREPYSHAVMEEHHRRKALSFLNTGYPQ